MSRTVDLLIFDDMVPSGLSPFRETEYEHYLTELDAWLVTYGSWETWFPGLTLAAALERSAWAVEAKRRVSPVDAQDIDARLGYVTFVHNALRALPWLEAHRLPFVLQLYPGGGFQVDQRHGQALSRVLDSALLRRVIATQSLTVRYLVDDLLFPSERVAFVYGGVFARPASLSARPAKKFMGVHKETFDLCFVAHRYGRDLTSKGYDRFVALARLLVRMGLANVRFHVVGGYEPGDVPLDGVADRFAFYGIREQSFFESFYAGMDCIIALNKPFVRQPGNFDGFPTGACIEAGLRGVLVCANDPLGLNPGFTDLADIILLPEAVDAVAQRVAELIRDPNRVYRLAYANMRAFERAFDPARQLDERVAIIRRELDPDLRRDAVR